MRILKRALKDAWKKLLQDLINTALEAWPKCFYKIYAAKGGHIENSKLKIPSQLILYLKSYLSFKVPAKNIQHFQFLNLIFKII